MKISHENIPLLLILNYFMFISPAFHPAIKLGLLNVPFWVYWTSPKIVAIKKTINTDHGIQWLGDVKNGDMTNDPCGL